MFSTVGVSFIAKKLFNCTSARQMKKRNTKTAKTYKSEDEGQ